MPGLGDRIRDQAVGRATRRGPSGSSAGDRVRDDAPGRMLAQEGAAAALERGDAGRALLVYQQLVEQYGDGDSYLGLSRAALASGDEQLAIETLRRGSRHLIEKDRREGAICLLEEALGLAPLDIAIHRRLVAAHANAGDRAGAVREHARFVRKCIEAGEVSRAIDELEYARGTLGRSADLDELERTIWLAGHRPAAAAHRVPERRPDPLPPRSTRLAPAVAPVPATTALSSTIENAERTVLPEKTVVPDRTAVPGADRNGADECIASARALIDQGKLDAAADLLVGYVVTGRPDRAVQRLLIDVERALGRPDLAAEKAHLLARLLELDGDPSAAFEMERLALAS